MIIVSTTRFTIKYENNNFSFHVTLEIKIKIIITIII